MTGAIVRYSVPLFCMAALSLGGCDKQNLDVLASLSPPSKSRDASQQSPTKTLYLTIVEGLIEQGRYRAALGYLDQYAVEEKKTPRFNMLRGEALLGVARYDEAAQSFSDLVGTDLEAAGLNGLGRVDAAREHWAEAELNFGKAVAARPSSADFLNNLGFAQLHLGEAMLPKAEFNLRQAQEIDPSSSSIRNNLVLILMMEGKEDDARRVLDSIAVPRERAAVQKFAADWIEARHMPAAE